MITIRKLFFLFSVQRNVFIKVFLFFAFLLIFPISISYVFIRQSSLEEIKKPLIRSLEIIKRDVVYRKGKWNVDLYNTDPRTSSPISTYAYPLYIITSDGFVIERSRPISGFLDSADYTYLSSFKTHHTITTPTHEKWRIVSKNIQKNNKNIGVVSVLYYAPEPRDLAEIDKNLSATVEKISTQMKKFPPHTRIRRSDVKNIPYNISYEVVDNFNKIIVTKGRVPSIIDASYIASHLQQNEKIITDSVTSDQYFIMSQPLTDEKGLPVGVVIAGSSLTSLYSVLNNYLIFSFLSRFLFTIPLTLIVVYILRKELIILLKSDERKIISKIFFDSKQSVIYVDDNKITIPYASNQYYLCKAVFMSPRKKWETDELLEKFGDNTVSGNGRKVYDAMLAINKKLGVRIVLHKDKRYVFNPDMLSKLAI